MVNIEGLMWSLHLLMHSDMITKLKYAFLLMLFCCVHSQAQSIAQAEAMFNEYTRILSTSGENITAYNSLYACYEQYWGILAKKDDEYNQAKEGLKNVFPHLYKGVYYFFPIDRARSVQFDDAYIAISVHPAMQNENLYIGSDYGQLAWLSASENYNLKRFDKAILGFQAYINSGEVKNMAEAYYRAAKSYELLKDIPHAQYVLEQGLIVYPDDKRLLALAINILGENKSDDEALQKYITKMMKYTPNDEILINIQAQLFERQKDYEKAAETYNRLKKIKPQSLEVSRHLAVNYYNAGVKYANMSLSAENNGEIKKTAPKWVSKLMKPENSDGNDGYKQLAKSYFTRASKVLDEVIHSDPLALNYVYSLANAYAYIGDNKSLQSINGKLRELGLSPVVSSEINLEEMDYNKTSLKHNLLADVPTQNSNNKHSAQGAKNGSRKKNKSHKKSDVDINIPVNKTDNKHTFAVIIANEKYHKVSNVANAENDANVFSEYCNKVLGIPSENIRKHLNLTFGGMLDAIDEMKAISSAKHGNCKFIFYYAGHGFPDEKTKSAYILPVDADGKQMRICYPLSALYSDFSALNAECVTVFMDACFSGATRNVDAESGKQMMLSDARSVEIDVDDEEIDGNVVVFSAASDSQTALSYDDQHHGMFTYYLLKKLKETKGDICLKDLSEYLIDEVSLNSQLKNRKQQTPTLITGYSIGNKWEKMKLK